MIKHNLEKTVLAISLLGVVVFAEPLDPCGSPREVYTKHTLEL